MSEQLKKQINYTVVCVNEFARKKALHPRTAFLYLYQYKGIEFLEEFYEIEHTLSLDDAVEDLELICRKNGGDL
jgi:hypothetical protein